MSSTREISVQLKNPHLQTHFRDPIDESNPIFKHTQHVPKDSIEYNRKIIHAKILERLKSYESEKPEMKDASTQTEQSIILPTSVINPMGGCSI
jgi:hypothetical protein